MSSTTHALQSAEMSAKDDETEEFDFWKHTAETLPNNEILVKLLSSQTQRLAVLHEWLSDRHPVIADVQHDVLANVYRMLQEVEEVWLDKAADHELE